MDTRNTKQMIRRSQVTHNTKFFTFQNKNNQRLLKAKNTSHCPFVDNVLLTQLEGININSTTDETTSHESNSDTSSLISIEIENKTFIDKCFYDSPPPSLDTKLFVYKCKFNENGKICEKECHDPCGFTSGCIKHYGWEEYLHKYFIL